MARWLFETVTGTYDSYTFDISPNAATSAVPVRGISWQYTSEGFTGVREGRTPHPWEFSGVLRSKAQLDALTAWLSKRVKVQITTDLGQVFIVRLLAFSPTQKAGHRNRKVPYRHEYTMKCLILP